MNNADCLHKKTPVEMRGPGTSKHCIKNMAADEEGDCFGFAKCFSPVETYLNPQRSSRRPLSWIFIRNILFILPLGAERMEWRSVPSVP